MSDPTFKAMYLWWRSTEAHGPSPAEIAAAYERVHPPKVTAEDVLEEWHREAHGHGACTWTPISAHGNPKPAEVDTFGVHCLQPMAQIAAQAEAERRNAAREGSPPEGS